MTHISFFIAGNPVAKGRPKFTKQGRAYTPEKTRRAEESLLAQAVKFRPETPITTPIELTVEAVFPWPQHPNKSHRAGHTTRPDCDNLAKTLCDALNGIFWQDDALINRLIVSKSYGDSPGWKVEINAPEIPAELPKQKREKQGRIAL